MIWKGYEMNWLQSNLAYDPGICPERPWDTIKKLNHVSQSVAQDLSPIPPRYGEGMLTI